ncbi:MAG TPA: hypothetical protein VNX25_10145, partial [Verrucomicrobiae bacterium]|nr:hypothetical protein [Verrucomicrobiae bacterium]
MRKRNLTNILLVLAALLLIGVFGLALRVQPVPDAVAVVDVPAEMAVTCSGELRKALADAPGVAGVNMIP